MPAPIFPVHLCNPSGVKADVVANVINGGTSISGIQTATQTDGGGRWQIVFQDMTINSVSLHRLITQWNSYLAGGTRIVRVPVTSIYTAPRPFIGNRPIAVPSLYYDDKAFPQEVRYAVPYIIAKTVGTASLRATQLTINVLQGARIEGGEKFSIGERAYVIERVVSRSGQIATVVISPPLRAATTNDSIVNFDWPVVRCRMALDQDFVPSYSAKYGSASITFIEDFSDAV